MPTSTALLLLSSAVLHCVVAHSWIACTDYEEMNGHFYDDDKCRAYARSGHRYTPRTARFGAETGAAYVPNESAACKTKRNDLCGYNPEYPMAKYHLGQTVVIAHPTKNHANDPRCNQRNNLDNGNWVYAYPTSPDADGDLSMKEWKQPEYLLADLGISPVDGRPGYSRKDFITYPKVGFQNAPAYCEGTDGALATNNITIPMDWAPGRYSFMWLWYQGCKSLSCGYTSCWEADIYETEQEARQAREDDQAVAPQEAAIGFNSNWGAGADGWIEMPPNWNTTYVIVRFPVKVGAFSVWGANSKATPEQRERGEFELHQRGTWWQPARAGFTLSFSTGDPQLPCAASLKAIETRLMRYPDAHLYE